MSTTQVLPPNSRRQENRKRHLVLHVPDTRELRRRRLHQLLQPRRGRYLGRWREGVKNYRHSMVVV